MRIYMNRSKSEVMVCVFSVHVLLIVSVVLMFAVVPKSEWVGNMSVKKCYGTKRREYVQILRILKISA
jgi:hypothetical protein